MSGVVFFSVALTTAFWCALIAGILRTFYNLPHMQLDHTCIYKIRLEIAVCMFWLWKKNYILAESFAMKKESYQKTRKQTIKQTNKQKPIKKTNKQKTQLSRKEAQDVVEYFKHGPCTSKYHIWDSLAVQKQRIWYY